MKVLKTKGNFIIDTYYLCGNGRIQSLLHVSYHVPKSWTSLVQKIHKNAVCLFVFTISMIILYTKQLPKTVQREP